MLNVLDQMNEISGQIVKLKIGYSKLSEHIAALEKFKENLKIKFRGLVLDVNLETSMQEDINQQKRAIAAEIQLGVETNFKKLIADEFSIMREEMMKIKYEISSIKRLMARLDDKTIDLEQKITEIRLCKFELFQPKNPIDNFLKYKTSTQQLLDSFLFGSTFEKLAFQSICFHWSINNFEQLVPTEGVYSCRSDIFFAYGSQLEQQLTLTIDSKGNVQFYLFFKDKVCSTVNFQITYIINNLSEQNQSIIKHGWATSIVDVPKSEWNAFISPYKPLKVAALVEPPTISNKISSVNGTITDTFEHYSRKIQMAKEGLIEYHTSPPFLTHAGGFRVAVWMRLNAVSGKNERGIEAMVYVLSNNCCSQLINLKRLEFKICIMLINQQTAKKNITVKKQVTNTNPYCVFICSVDKICSGSFLMNDSLTYCIRIDPSKEMMRLKCKIVHEM